MTTSQRTLTARLTIKYDQHMTVGGIDDLIELIQQRGGPAVHNPKKFTIFGDYEIIAKDDFNLGYYWRELEEEVLGAVDSLGFYVERKFEETKRV